MPTHQGEWALSGSGAQGAAYKSQLRSDWDANVLTLDMLADYSLQENGFVAFQDIRGAAEACDHGGLQQMLDAFACLPQDPYAAAANRFRRYDHAVILPWSRQLSWIPPLEGQGGERVAGYYQGTYNPEHPGARRLFPAFDENLRANPLLNALVWHDLDLTFWEDREAGLPLHVGMHMVKLLVAEPGAEAVSSPNMLHRDGEPFTFAHLITRNNVGGGENVIAPPRCAGFHPDELAPGTIKARFKLRLPLESYGVHDPKVSHYVAAIRQRDPAQPAERSVLLIDFAVMAVAV